MRSVARSTTAPGRPSEYWTYMLSSQSRAGNCGHAGSTVKRLKISSTRPRGSVCGKLPTSEGAAQKRGCCILQLLRSSENRTASTPCAIPEIRIRCSDSITRSRAFCRQGRAKAKPVQRCRSGHWMDGFTTSLHRAIFYSCYPEMRGIQSLCSRRKPCGRNVLTSCLAISTLRSPARLFPEVRIAGRCPIRCLVFLDRQSDGPARLDRVRSADVVASLLADMPSYGAEVNATHEKTIHSLAGLPAWQLRYRALEDAVRLLSEIPIPPEGNP